MTPVNAAIVENEAELVAIARGMRTVAVVGIKNGERDPDAPGFSVPEMMKAMGLEIIGINPHDRERARRADAALGRGAAGGRRRARRVPPLGRDRGAHRRDIGTTPGAAAGGGVAPEWHPRRRVRRTPRRRRHARRAGPLPGRVLTESALPSLRPRSTRRGPGGSGRIGRESPFGGHARSGSLDSVRPPLPGRCHAPGRRGARAEDCSCSRCRSRAGRPRE